MTLWKTVFVHLDQLQLKWLARRTCFILSQYKKNICFREPLCLIFHDYRSKKFYWSAIAVSCSFEDNNYFRNEFDIWFEPCYFTEKGSKPIVVDNVSVYWPLMNSYYNGHVQKINEDKYVINYKDGDAEVGSRQWQLEVLRCQFHSL